MRASLGIILLLGFMVRVVLLIVNLEFMTLPQGGGDALGFERKAWEHSQLGRESLSYYVLSDSEFIVLPGSLVYDVTGRAPYVLGLLMVVLGLGVVYLVYRAVLELWENEKVARTAAWSAALFPQLVLHSALFLREIPVALCLAGAALCVVKYVKRQRVRYVVAYAAWIALGAFFHSGVIFALPALVVGVMIARPLGIRTRLSFYIQNVFAALLLAGLLFVGNETGFGLGKFGGSLDVAMETFEVRELRSPDGGAAFPEWMRVRGDTADMWKVPVRYVALLFSPLVPYLVRSPSHLLGAADALLYIWLFWQLLWSWKDIRRNRAVVVLLVVMLTLFLVYALGVSNFGTAIRHRAKMAPLLLILAGGLPYLRGLMARQKLNVKRWRARQAAGFSIPGREIA